MSTLYQYDRVADRARLHRQGDDRPIVIVEGEADKRFILRILGGDIEVFVARTRDRVLDAARDIAARPIVHAACVVDRDFDDAVATVERICACMAPYDDADLESMLWNTASLDSLIVELATETKLSAFGGVQALRLAALDVLTPVARLRRANALHGWGLNFDEDLQLNRRIGKTSLSIDVRSLCDGLFHPDLPIDLPDLISAAETQELSRECPSTNRKLIRGRDALTVASVAMRRLLGNYPLQAVRPEHLADTLRLATQPAHVGQTRWRTQLQALLGV